MANVLFCFNIIGKPYHWMRMKIYIRNVHIGQVYSVYNYYNLYVCTLGKGYTRTSVIFTESFWRTLWKGTDSISRGNIEVIIMTSFVLHSCILWPYLAFCIKVIKAVFTTNTATFAVYVFQAFTLIQQLHFHCDSSFVFISIHFDIRIHFYPFWVCVFAYQCDESGAV